LSNISEAEMGVKEWGTMATLLIGMSSQAGAFSAEDLHGVFDGQGNAFLTLHIVAGHYFTGEITGVQILRMRDKNGQHWRTLLNDAPVDGPQMLRSTVPSGDIQHVTLQGPARQNWHLRYQQKPLNPLDKDQALIPLSPTLQAVTPANLADFWLRTSREGTPLIEPFDTHHKRVTFLWRGAKKNVFLMGSPEGDHDPLFHLAGTDIWFRSYVVPDDTLMQYQLAPDIPQVPEGGREQRLALLVTAQADPLNKQVALTDADDVFTRSSLLNLQHKTHCLLPPEGREPLKGSLRSVQFNSAILGNLREITLYQSPDATPDSTLLLVFDGKTYQKKYRLHEAFERLTARGDIAPLRIVFIDSLDGERRGRELPPNPAFSDFMAYELIPWLQQQGFTSVANHTVIAGSSYGGLASAWVAMRYPKIFGNVLSLSGSYWWAPEGEKPEWLIREYSARHTLPLRFYLQAGLFENKGEEGGILGNNIHLRDALREKGYEVVFRPYASGHDYAAWCEAMIDGVRHLQRGIN
jgi:enterochelin esterase family protein